MKILRVISSMHPSKGGPSQGIRNAIPEQKKLGIINDVVCFDQDDADYLKNDKFNVYTLGKSSGPWAYNKRLIDWLLAHFNKYDVVIIHGLWLYHGYAAYKAWSKFKKQNVVFPKLYVMPHGMLDPYFQTAPERRIKAIRNLWYWRLIEKKMVNGVDGLLFTCEEELKLARQSFPNYKPKSELNIGYGILPPTNYSEDMTEELRVLLPNWNGKPFLLFLSRIHPKKGLDLLIKAYLQLEKISNKVLPQLIIAGPGGETSYGQELMEVAKQSENILFPGMLQGNAKWGAFYNCEAFVLPSHQENFGIAIVEALACGKPVLITNKVNIWREIKEGNAGFVVEDMQEAILLQLEEWLKLLDQDKREMGLMALKVYENKFLISTVSKYFKEFLK